MSNYNNQAFRIDIRLSDQDIRKMSIEALRQAGNKEDNYENALESFMEVLAKSNIFLEENENKDILPKNWLEDRKEEIKEYVYDYILKIAKEHVNDKIEKRINSIEQQIKEIEKRDYNLAYWKSLNTPYKV